MIHQTTVSRSITEIPKTPWNSLCANHPFAQHRWLRLLEATLAHYEPRYIQIEHHGQLVAGAICNLKRTFRMSAYMNNPIISQLSGMFFKHMPPMYCGVPIFSLPGFMIHPDADTKTWQPHLLAAIGQLTKQEGTFMSGFDCLDQNGRSDLLAQQEFFEVPIIPESYIDIQWDSFADYQDALPKKSRSEIRRVRNRAVEQGIAIEAVPLTPELSPIITPLTENVSERHGNTHPYQPDFIRKAIPYLRPEDYRFLLIRQDGDVIGCAALFHCDGEVIVKWGGFDYPRTEPTFAYHYLLTETVRHAIEMKAKRLTMGMTVYTLKKKLGAVLEERFLLMHMRLRPLNHLANYILNRDQEN